MGHTDGPGTDMGHTDGHTHIDKGTDTHIYLAQVLTLHYTQPFDGKLKRQTFGQRDRGHRGTHAQILS